MADSASFDGLPETVRRQVLETWECLEPLLIDQSAVTVNLRAVRRALLPGLSIMSRLPLDLLCNVIGKEFFRRLRELYQSSEMAWAPTEHWWNSVWTAETLALAVQAAPPSQRDVDLPVPREILHRVEPMTSAPTRSALYHAVLLSESPRVERHELKSRTLDEAMQESYKLVKPNIIKVQILEVLSVHELDLEAERRQLKVLLERYGQPSVQADNVIQG